jgi:hypothetical protein
LEVRRRHVVKKVWKGVVKNGENLKGKEERGKNKRNVNFTGLNQGEGAKIKAKRRNCSLSQEGEKFIGGWGIAIWFSYRYQYPCLVQWQKARFFTTRSPVQISRNIAYFPPILFNSSALLVLSLFNLKVLPRSKIAFQAFL